MAKRTAEEQVQEGESPTSKRNRESEKDNGNPWSPGIIKSVYVENFMCHRALEVQLCRNVNFIHGQNGSGKSAILAAVQICLGAGARRTNRARNLKELIRSNDGGSERIPCARVQVTVANSADDGYKYDVYGDSITVERTIANGSGYNGYKLLDSNRKEQSRSKKDVDDMLDMLNIQVENPVAVLDQEEAKKFLTGKSTDKYQFFSKATELERVDRVYGLTIDQVQELEANKQKISDSLEPAKQIVKDLKAKHVEHQRVNQLTVRESKLMAQYGCASYQEKLEEKEAMEARAASIKGKLEKRTNELQELEAAAHSPEDASKAHAEQIQQLTKEAEEQRALVTELEQSVKDVLQPQKAKQRQLQQMERRIQQSRQSLEMAQKRLKQARDDVIAQAGNAQAQAAERTAALQKAEEDLNACRERVRPLQQALSVARQEFEKVEPHIQDAKGNVQRVQNQLNGVRNTISQLQSSSGTSLAMFGRRVPKVVELIKRTKFDGPVVGPIGKYIKVASGKDEFTELAQLALGGGNMDRFIVTNSQDRLKLNQLRRQAGCQSDCGVYQCVRARRHNVPSPPVDGVETVATVLQIDDDLVFNCLVDQARIEMKALCRSKDESEKMLLTRDSNNKQVIRGVIKEVYCMPSGDRWSCNNGLLSIVSNERRRVNVVIGVDKTKALRQSQAEEQSMMDDLREYRQVESRLEKEHSDHQKEWSQGKRQVQQNDKRIEELQEQISSLRDEIDTTADTTIDTTGFEENVTAAEQTVEESERTHETLQREIEEGKPEIESRKTRLQEAVIRSKKVMGDLEVAQQEMTQLLDTQSQRDQELEKKREKLEKIKTNYEAAIKEVETVTRDCKKCMLKAKKLTFTYSVKSKQNDRQQQLQERDEVEQEEEEEGGDEPEEVVDPSPEILSQLELQAVDNAPDYYRARIEKTRERIAAEKEKRKMHNEDPVSVYQKYVRAKKTLQGKMDQVEEIDEKVQELHKDMKARQKRWRQFQRHLSKKTGDEFNKILAMNNYSGQVEFDHFNHTLDLVVSKDGAGATQTKDVKALSGGERSFATMALLIAMGENLETPFRVMDEFDVFMDAQARKLTIQILIHVAKKMAHRQFIFITPQDLSSLTPDPQLKIMKLHAPDRRRSAGGPSQQTLAFSQTA